MRIIINGAGIAGPTLAYWLLKSGHEVLLVEQAPTLRTGGYVIDFWGIGYTIAQEMGLLPRIAELGYQVKEMRYVNRRGRKSGGFPVAAFAAPTGGRYTQLRRSDLAATIYQALDGKAQTLFGDSVAGIADHGDFVRVTFDRAQPREADLVVGADGLHSRVRRLAFSDEPNFEVPLGYHVAAFEVAGYRPREDLVAVSHAAPGRQITRLAMPDDKTLFLFVFRDEYLAGRHPDSATASKSVLTRVFADVGWEGPEILGAMRNATDIYFDSVSQIRMANWTRGRTALVGDAAACVSLLAGEGTGLAMAESYVLARELDAHSGNHVAAFARYEERLMPFLAHKQQSAAKLASSFAPRTRLGIALRDRVTRLLAIPFMVNFLVGRLMRDDIELPPWPHRSQTDHAAPPSRGEMGAA